MPRPESTVVQVKSIMYSYQTRSWSAKSGGAYISTLRPPELVGMPLTQFSRSIHQWLIFDLIHKRPLPNRAVAAYCGYCSAVWKKPAGYKQLSSGVLVVANETACSKQRCS